jgi:sugar phosphate isomerase/epimerase
MQIRITRRTMMEAAAIALAGTRPIGGAPVDDKPRGLKLGVASYSLRKLSRPDAIKAMKTLETPYINIKEFHIALKATPDEVKAARKEFEDAGLKILGVGNITFNKDDDAEMRRNFEYAKMLGAPVMVMAPTHALLPKIERLVKEYNIKAAIHNHGPEDKHFPAPSDVLKAVKGMDQRMGLCIDIGHTSRTNDDILESIKAAGARLHDIHVKDLRDPKDKASQVPVGHGALPIVGMFKLLQSMNYQGGVMLEYEIEADNPVPGMQKSFDYMRGVLDGLRG